MRLHAFLASTLAIAASQAANILLTNDDGWAEVNIRTIYDALSAHNNSVVMSAPVTDKSFFAYLQAPPARLGKAGCPYFSCPPNSPPTGNNISQPRMNYVNSFAVTAMRHGVKNVAPKYFGGRPDLVIAGINVGATVGLQLFSSGAAAALSEAWGNYQVPGIAFSGVTGKFRAWNYTVPDHSLIYAELAAKVTEILLASGAPLLPPRTFLNVNFAAAGPRTACRKASEFEFILTRAHTPVPVLSHHDIRICGSRDRRLPQESKVVKLGCYVTLSLVNTENLRDARAKEQAVLYKKFRNYLKCLPRVSKAFNVEKIGGTEV